MEKVSGTSWICTPDYRPQYWSSHHCLGTCCRTILSPSYSFKKKEVRIFSQNRLWLGPHSQPAYATSLESLMGAKSKFPFRLLCPLLTHSFHLVICPYVFPHWLAINACSCLTHSEACIIDLLMTQRGSVSQKVLRWRFKPWSIHQSKVLLTLLLIFSTWTLSSFLASRLRKIMWCLASEKVLFLLEGNPGSLHHSAGR